MKISKISNQSFKKIGSSKDVLINSAKILSLGGKVNVLWDYKTGGIIDRIFNDIKGETCINTLTEDLVVLKPDGKLKWKKKLTFSGLAEDSSGKMLVASHDKNTGLICFDRDGNELWHNPVSSEIMTEPVIAKSGDILVGSWDGNLYCLDNSGKKKWEFKTGKEIIYPPAIDSSGNIYFANKDRKLFALDKNGCKLWENSCGMPKQPPDVLNDGTIIYFTEHGAIFAFNPAGEIKWTQNKICVACDCSELFHDKFQNLYLFTSEDEFVSTSWGQANVPVRYLYSFGPDGSFKWRERIENSPEGEPAFDSKGNICFSCSGGNFYIFDANGKQKGKFQADNGERLSPPAVNEEEGAVYLAGSSGNFYILDNFNGRLISKQKITAGELKTYYAPAAREDKSILLAGADGTLYSVSMKPQKKFLNEKLQNSHEKPGIENLGDKVKIGKIVLNKNNRF